MVRDRPTGRVAHDQHGLRDTGETDLTGVEADDVYAPHEHLAAVGSRIILMAPVVHHLRGDDRRWDRIAIAQYRDRMALAEMSSSDEFQTDEQHKDAGMAFTIGRFWIEDRFVGDHRTFAEARFHPITPDTADELASRKFVHDDTGYALIADPVMDAVARSLTGPTRVLF